MTTPTTSGSGEQRGPLRAVDLSCVEEMTCHDKELAPAKGLHSIVILFRILAGILGLVMVMQVVSGVSGAIDISYGVLIAEAIRLVVFAAVLWAAGDLSELFIKSHADIRAIRILLAQPPPHTHTLAGPGAARPSEGGERREAP